MPHTAEVAFACASPALAEAVAKALAVEASDGPEGSGLQVQCRGSQLVLAVAAPDVATLRAALNSAVRLADVALRAAAV